MCSFIPLSMDGWVSALIVNNGAMTWVYKHLSQTLLLGVHAPEVELLDRVVIAFNSLRSSPS